jgi:predicted  nucleic acid-binding Zn-ribbon protein
MEQQLLVSAAERVLFMASDWEKEDGGEWKLVEEYHCWYSPNPKLRQKILAGWAQFEKDLETHEPRPDTPRVVAQPMDALPAVLVNVKGTLAVDSNLTKLVPVLRGFIDKIPAKPSTDQEFADTEAACKALKKFEEALDAEETRALASIEDVQTLRQLKAQLYELSRTTRLAREKMVEARKKEIRFELHQEFTTKLDDHVANLNKALDGHPFMPRTQGDWAGVMKGLRTVSSAREACNNELAQCKIAADEVFRRIQQNLNALREHASEHKFLFADTPQLILKPCDDVLTIIKARIAEHVAEEQRKAKAAEEKRQREEAEANARREREQQEAQARQQREAEAAAQRKPQPQTAAPTAVAANAPTTANVIDMPAAAPARGKPTLTLKAIHERLGIPVTATFIGTTLNIAPAKVETNKAVLWHEGDFDRICQALMFHVDQVRMSQLQAA